MSLLDGGIAGSVSAKVTCPIEVVKTHLQASRYGSEMALVAGDPIDMARNIMGVKTVRGFFRGILRTLIGFSQHAPPTSACTLQPNRRSLSVTATVRPFISRQQRGEHLSNIQKILPD